MSKFPMTSKGYLDAKQWLEDNDMIEEFNSNSQSVDGYSLIYFANYRMNRSSRYEKSLKRMMRRRERR